MIYSRFLSAGIVSTSIATIAFTVPVVANPAVDRIAAEITGRIEGPQGEIGLYCSDGVLLFRRSPPGIVAYDINHCTQQHPHGNIPWLYPVLHSSTPARN